MVEPASNEESRGAGLDGDASVGALVRRARERRGMSINDLSSCLKLEPRTLEALELEAYDKLPPAAPTPTPKPTTKPPPPKADPPRL